MADTGTTTTTTTTARPAPVERRDPSRRADDRAVRSAA